MFDFMNYLIIKGDRHRIRFVKTAPYEVELVGYEKLEVRSCLNTNYNDLDPKEGPYLTRGFDVSKVGLPSGKISHFDTQGDKLLIHLQQW